MPGRASPQLRQAVLDALPGRQAQIARKLGRKPGDNSVARHLKRLLDDGVIWRDGPIYTLPPIVPPLSGYEWPAHFDEVTRRAFVAKVAQWQAQGVWDDEDIELLERYVTAVQVGRLARARIAANAAPDDPLSGYTTKGSQGQLVQHPDLKTAREAERDAQVYEDKLRERQDLRLADAPPPADDGDQSGL